MSDERFQTPRSTGLDQTGGGLLSAISTEMVSAMKRYYGKGPVSAKSYFVDDLLFVVMREGITQSEQTMLQAGREDSVRQFRQEFENEMTSTLTAMVERLTGRHVVTYQSQILFDPNLTIEMFVFSENAKPEELSETAIAIAGGAAGRAFASELDHPSGPDS